VCRRHAAPVLPPIHTGMCRHLVDWLSELRDQLALHFALEEAYGYFDEPLHVAPQLAEKANTCEWSTRSSTPNFGACRPGRENVLRRPDRALAVWSARNSGFRHPSERPRTGARTS